jgi:hypothetical protein
MFDRGEEMIGAELFEERTVLEVVMDQVRRPGDLDGCSPLAELAG